MSKTQIFIEKARAKHGDRYDYSKVVYVRTDNKVTILCMDHGYFWQTPNNHLRGQGCGKCAGKNRTTPERIDEAKKMHGDLYDYSKTVYVRNSDKVVITCKEHGDFDQTPANHLSGSGCPSCPARRDHPTNLYLMHNGLGKVKIGYSIDTKRRISQLNRESPFKAELLESWTLADTPTALKIESKVHRKLAKYQAGLSGFDGASEWFNITPERAKNAILKALSGAVVLSYSNANSSQLSLL